MKLADPDGIKAELNYALYLVGILVAFGCR